MSRVDAKLSKRDRFLACLNFLNAFPSLTATAHPKKISYHIPITLSNDKEDFGPPFFKFFNSWLLLEELDQFVHNAWARFHGYGNVDVYLAAKLKHLKEGIRKWRKEEHNKEKLEWNNTKETIRELEKLAETRELSPNKLQTKSNGLQKLLVFVKQKLVDMKQISNNRWVVDGDENSTFFHGYVNNNKRKILNCGSNDKWEIVYRVKEIKKTKPSIFSRTNSANNGCHNPNLSIPTSNLLI